MRRSRIVSFIQAALLSVGLGGVKVNAQPAITGITPDGSVMFQPSEKLSFSASAPAGIDHISVQLNGRQLSGATFLKVYTSTSGLTIAPEAGGGQTASAPLLANTVYNATITAVDAAGASTTSTVAFDTITPAYTFEAEDFDFEGGQYIDNPQTNSYSGKVSYAGFDANNSNGGGSYRPVGTVDDPSGLSSEGCGDTPRAQYASSGLTDYDVGYTDAGDWANYTRHFPADAYNLFLRAANPNPAGTRTIEVSGPVYGQFNVPNTGNWQVYTWVPLVDADGNRVEFNPDGSAQTLLITTVAGIYNANFYMLVPAIPNTTPVSDATIVDAYPDGTFQFQSTNKFTFTVSSTLGVNAADVAIQLAATNLSLKGISKLLTPDDGLTITGDSKSLSVSLPLTNNMVYNVLISVSDANGVPMTHTLKFDTITPAYTWEAEDWDYDAGQFIDNPQVNAYSGLYGFVNIDYARPSAEGGSAYGREGLATENANDVPRLDRDPTLQDYDIGNNGAGNWVNYTRNWPAGIYNIFIRVANGSSATPEAGALSLVTSGLGTENQATSQLGSYSSPVTGGWQTYGWRPVLDSAGNLARFVGGSKKTLRHTVSGGNANQGFYMLIPADTSERTLPFVNNFKPDGLAMFQPTNRMSFTANSVPGLPTDGVSVTLDGVKITGLTFQGSANDRIVSCPVSLNGVHVAVVTLTDEYGSTTNTVRFATFDSSATYIFEAEDYDFNGGEFIDNPQVNAYEWLDAIAEVDTHVVSGFDGTHVPYRPSGLNQENSSDVFVTPGHAGLPNFNLSHTVAGNWGNYTRTFPAGKYNIYLRAANGNTTTSSGGSMQQVIAGLGTTDQTTVNLGTFDSIPPTGGWQAYAWTPLREASGNLVEFEGGSAKTLRAICGGGQNMDYYALAPVDASRPVLSGLYPNGSSMFQQTNTLRFVASSSAGVDTNTISVELNGAPLTNLTIAGSSESWNVSYPHLLPDMTYTVRVAFTSKGGGVFSKTFAFDTFSASNYSWEAEDFDYDNGSYIDVPQTNAYAGLTGVDSVDAHNSDGGGAYRPVGTAEAPGGLATEACGDFARAPYIGTGMTDYNVGYTTAGDWANYTRHYPNGSYYIFMRAANPNASGTDTVEVSGPVSGRFNVATTGNWQVYAWAPLVDANGDRVVFTSDGSARTMLIKTIAGIYNVNFYMLVPATSSPTTPVATASFSAGSINISFGAQAGLSYQVQYKTTLNESAWTPLGSSFSGNGSVQVVTDTPVETSRFYRVAVVNP